MQNVWEVLRKKRSTFPHGNLINHKCRNNSRNKYSFVLLGSRENGISAKIIAPKEFLTKGAITNLFTFTEH